MDDTSLIRVFNDDEVWSQYARWWDVPRSKRLELYVTTYEVDAEDFDNPRVLKGILKRI